ncbi:MAG: DUF364 domain-containing protein [Candidatus Lokiarchaeota archaeon]
MSIAQDFVKIIEKIEDRIKIPLIKEIFVPNPSSLHEGGKHNFGAFILEDNTIGLVFLSLNKSIEQIGKKLNLNEYIGQDPIIIAKNFISANEFKKTLALGAINSICQFIFKKVNFEFDYTTDSMGLLNLSKGDKIGMVGFFPPLVRQIENLDLSLTVIERKKKFIQKHEKWEVTLNPKKLLECNKILCTSTTVLNDSVDDILLYTKNAQKISMIGPTAGFFPDPLFKRRIDVLGGTYVSNPQLFINLIQKGKKWSSSTRKYCIQKEKYQGFDLLLQKLSH